MSVQITYNIVPPTGTPQVAETSSTVSCSGPTESHYAGVISALRDAQQQLNARLTTWKDAIGDSEKAREDLGTVGYGQGKASRASRDAGETAGQAGTEAGDGAEDSEDE